MLVPVAMTTVDSARRPNEQIKWKEIAGALRRIKEIKAGFSGICGHLLDLHTHIEMTARDSLGGGDRRDLLCLAHRMPFREAGLTAQITDTDSPWLAPEQEPAPQWQPVLSSGGDGLFYLPAHPTSVEFALMGRSDLETHTELCFRIDWIENKHVG